MARMDKLWKAAGGPGTPPSADSRVVKARVNAALDADQRERSIYMRQKLRLTIVAAAVAIAVTGSALAITIKEDIVQYFFRGDTTSAQEYVDSTVRSISDENYTLTVESSMADEETIYLTMTCTAKNEEARAFLFSSDFCGIDTFSIHTKEHSLSASPDENTPQVTSVGTSNKIEAVDENSRRFHLRVQTTQSTSALMVGLGYMDEEAVVEVPVTPAPSVTVEIGASGMGLLGADRVTLTPSPITVDRVKLSPFTCHIHCSDVPVSFGYETNPRILFRMADGSIRTQSQMMDLTNGSYDSFYDGDDGISYGQAHYSYEFAEVQDLENITSIILWDVEYPLDGSAPTQVAHDPSLDPFTLPVIDPQSETGAFLVPVRALTETLGGACDWDPVTGDVTCVYRGVTVVLRPGDSTATVNGQPVSMLAAPTVQDGSLSAYAQLFNDAWGIECALLRHTSEVDGQMETVFCEWYIVP